jgi:hypothetical protein
MEVQKSVIIFLLGHFRKKPGMYLGKNHISLLSTFMTGYMTSLITNGLDPNSDPFYGQENDGFFNWYSKKNGITDSANWYLTILEESNNSEEEGLNLFFALLEEFCIVKNIDFSKNNG